MSCVWINSLWLFALKSVCTAYCCVYIVYVWSWLFCGIQWCSWNEMWSCKIIRPDKILSRPLNVEGLFEDHIWMYIGGREANSKPNLMPTPNQPLELSCVYSTFNPCIASASTTTYKHFGVFKRNVGLNFPCRQIARTVSRMGCIWHCHCHFQNAKFM